MKEIMLADTPVRDREQILRDSCDAIEERSYTRRFEQEECNQRKSELASVAIKINDLEQELAEIKADFKGRIKPLQERLAILRDEIKVNGEWVTADVYKFIDQEERRCGFYSGDGRLVEERPLTPGEMEGTIFSEIRRNNDKTGTEG